jgi:hypothetical protein
MRHWRYRSCGFGKVCVNDDSNPGRRPTRGRTPRRHLRQYLPQRLAGKSPRQSPRLVEPTLPAHRNARPLHHVCSIPGNTGNREQAWYAAGNTLQDSLSHSRRRQGLSSITVDLGAIADVGMSEDGTATAASSSTSDVVWMEQAELERISPRGHMGTS